MQGNVRKYHSRGYVTISNSIVNDWSLSPSALGLYARIQGLPDNWNLSLKGLTKTFCIGKDKGCGTDALRRALTEIEENGYLVRARQRNEDGKLGSALYVTIDDKELYGTVIADLEGDGLLVISKPPKGANMEAGKPFTVSGEKVFDSEAGIQNASELAEAELENAWSEPVSENPTLDVTRENAKTVENLENTSDDDVENPNRPALKTDPAVEKNPRSEPVSENPTLDVNRENAKTVETEKAKANKRPAEFTNPSQSAPRMTCENDENAQVGTSVGLAYVGKSAAKPVLKENQIINTQTSTVAGTSPAREATPTDGSGVSTLHGAVPHAVRVKDLIEPPGFSNTDDPLRDNNFKALIAAARNRNELSSQRDIEVAYGAYRRLIASGYSAEDILCAWKERQGGRDTAPTLKRWLYDSADVDVMRCSEERGERTTSRERAVAFAIARAGNAELDALYVHAKKVAQEAEWGLASPEAAKDAMRAAWDMFDKITKTERKAV